MAPKKGGNAKSGAGKKQLSDVPGSEHIVFGDGKKEKRKPKVPSEEEVVGPPQPTARQVIGGASWTGKLPVNILSEHCQKQKWYKPDYSMRQFPAQEGADKVYRSEVTLSKKDPKTNEVVKLPPFRLPKEVEDLASCESALEARHFAATYALFRVSSMKNIHMTLPPNYRDLWKGEFTRLKKEDTEAGRGWKYEEDPFAAEAKRHVIQAQMEARRIEQQKKAEAQSKEPNFNGNPRGHAEKKAWERAPKAEMGQQIRSDIEHVVRQSATWNPYSTLLNRGQKSSITADVEKLGFRRSHVEEAVEYCKDQEEVLEWLLVHVPEDDLPKWALPPNYSAGISLASGDLSKEAKLKRLARGGYPSDLCIRALKDCDGDETLAAASLQAGLVSGPIMTKEDTNKGQVVWEEEMETLGAIFSDQFTKPDEHSCLIHASTSTAVTFSIRFRCPGSNYPTTAVPIIAVEADSLPAYIRLSATRKAIIYARDSLMGDAMVYSICQWLESALPAIIQNPGKLSELHALSPRDHGTSDRTGTNEGSAGRQVVSSRPARRSTKDRRSDGDILNQWRTKQTDESQIKMIKARQSLPAWRKRDEVIQAISTKQITIVSGETGSGKSTQVVQFVLDNCITQLSGSTTNIVCTQPRRVATLSLADRVSSERCVSVGDEVGYVIRGESKVSEKTKITFMTTGVLLRRIQTSTNLASALEGLSHIVVDEVHERSLDTDFLLALLKDCLKVQPSLRVVLMSATLDAEIFSNYFGGPSKVALVHIEGRTHPVTDVYLDDVLSMTRFNMNGGSPTANLDPGKLIQSLGMGINYDLIKVLVECIDAELEGLTGSILIFLPGTLEIERCLRAVNGLPNIYGLPLHASLLPAEQRKVFPPAPKGRRKVVAATNVAETSITIEDIVAVIDTGRVKETNYDTTNNIVRLQEVWTSQASCKQRRGRAGRVRAGTCYKLFTHSMEDRMSSKSLPEIQRVPLEQLCLSVKATGADRDVAEFLSRTLTPPAEGAVFNAIQTLHTMGALEDNQLTALGTYLAMIPADLRCAKMLVYGVLFGCLEASLTIASILTVKSPFVSPKDKREEASAARLAFQSTHGDILLDMAAYDEWTNISYTERYRDVHDWCSSNFLSPQTLKDITSTRRQILDSLKDAGVIPLDYRSPQTQASAIDSPEHVLLLRALIAASLQPQIAAISYPAKKYISSVSGAKELDPEARTIKFFVADEAASQLKTDALSSKSTDGSSINTDLKSEWSRVFIHPSSCLFTSQTFSHHSTHMSYFTKLATSKIFVRDLTPLNVYTLLLFGGKLEIDPTGLGLTVGGIWKVRGWARIGVLVSRLRVLLDQELKHSVESGGVLMGALEENRAVNITRRLVMLNGQDQ